MGHDNDDNGQKPPPPKMGRPCLTCTHPRRLEIEKAIIDGIPYQRIARDITCGDPPKAYAIKNHAYKCVPEMVAKRACIAEEVERVSRETLEAHMREALLQAQESADRAMSEEDDESGRLIEGATGRTAALKAWVDIAKGTGEALGLIESKTRVEIILADPMVREFVERLLALVPDDRLEEARALALEYMG